MLPLDFTWTAPDTCPTRAEVMEQLSRAVDVGGKELPPLSAHAVVSRHGDSWRLELTTDMDGRRGTRLLEADSCEGLTRAATLVLALTLGEGLARRQAEDEARAAQSPAPVPPAPAPPAPTPTRSATSEASPQARRLAWLALGVSSDPLGGLAPGAALALAYQPRRLRVVASVDATLSRTSERSASGARARSTSVSGALAACLVPTVTPLQLVACGEASFTLLTVEGQGTERDQSARVPLYGLGPRLGAEWWLGERVFVSVTLASRFFVKRPELVIEGAPERRRVEVASAAATLGGGFEW